MTISSISILPPFPSVPEGTVKEKTGAADDAVPERLNALKEVVRARLSARGFCSLG